MTPAQPPSRTRLALRVAHLGLTITLLILTHWPRLSIESPIQRTDLYIHVLAFGSWTLLLGLAWPMRWWRLALLGLAFTTLDETTQPLFDRVFDPADLAANWLGVALGTALCTIWHHMTHRKSTSRAS